MSESAGPPPVPSSLAPTEDPRLTPVRKSFYAGGDFTVNTVLSSLSIVYVTYFLTQIAGLRPELAGAVQLVGRVVDAFTDPLMGRLSDRCRWSWGRRRPFFLIGAVPFGLSYAMLWVQPADSQLGMLAFYTGWYVLMSLAMTVLSVPYLAIQPEMALGYDARTSLNTYRNVGSVLGVFAAIAFRPVAQALGGGTAGFAAAGVVYGFVMVVPWLAVYFSTWERPDFQTREARVSLLEGLRILARIRSFRRLTGMYLCGRIAMDLIGAMLVIYFTHWIGRSEDFEPAMFLFLMALMCSLPIWLWIARHFDKSTIFIVGSAWWMASQAFVLLAQPHWPAWILFAFMPLVGIGYAMVDLMPWAMLGEVVDEDDVATGERREGLFYGVFMFLRKLGGTLAVAGALWVLGATGFTKGAAQTEQAVLAIRLLCSVVPAVFLAVSIAFAWRYPLTRRRHAQIRAQLDARNGRR